MGKDPLDDDRICKQCHKGYTLRKHGFQRLLALTYCGKECAIADGMSEEDANQQLALTVWRCAGCEQHFPHEDLTFRKGDYGYTPLCQTCADDPKYYCFFPYEDRLAAGLVTSKEREEHSRNWNAFHDM